MLCSMHAAAATAHQQTPMQGAGRSNNDQDMDKHALHEPCKCSPAAGLKERNVRAAIPCPCSLLNRQSCVPRAAVRTTSSATPVRHQ